MGIYLCARHGSRVAAGMLLGVLSLQAYAQERGIDLGGSRLQPSLALGYFSESNVLRRENSPQSSTGISLSPKVSWEGQKNTLVLTAVYEGIWESYQEDFTDYHSNSLSLDASTDFSIRARGELGFSFRSESERAGTGLNLGSDGQESLTRNVYTLSSAYTYGARGARGNVTAGLSLSGTSFSNDTAVASRSEFTEIEPFGVFSMRLGGTTRGFAEIRFVDQNYKLDSVDDREQTNLFLGVQWAESEVFDGVAKIGVLRYSAGGESNSDLGLDVTLNYRMSSFSSLGIKLAREVYQFNDALQLDDADLILTDSASMIWDHTWSSRFSHEIIMSADINERECGSDNEVNTSILLRARYRIRQWIALGASAGREGRDFGGCDSPIELSEDLNYTNDIYSIFLNVNY